MILIVILILIIISFTSNKVEQSERSRKHYRKDGSMPDMRFKENWIRDKLGNRMTKLGRFDMRFKTFKI